MRIHQPSVPFRRLTRLFFIPAVAVTLTLAPARAQNADSKAAPAAARPATPADDSVILPYLDEGTFLVARLDVDKVDPDAMATYLSKSFEMVMGQVPAQVRGQVQAQMMQQVETAKGWLKNMSDAGAKHIYILLDSADLGESGDGPVAIVPLGKDVDADKVKSLLSATVGGGQAQPEEVGKAIVIAEPSVVTRVKKRFEPGAAPVTRPDLAKAFAVAGDAPLRIAIVPGESSRKWVEDNLPQLPEELGGGETSVLSRGVKFASISIKQKPDTTANFAIHCENADKAKALLTAITKGTATLKQKLAGSPQEKEMTKKIDTLKPKLAGDTITMSINPMDIQLVGMGVVAPQAVAQPGAPAPAGPAKKDDGGL